MITKTLQEWAALDGIQMLDPDGFDRTDDKLFERQFTKEEYDTGLIKCTIFQKAETNSFLEKIKTVSISSKATPTRGKK